LLFSDLVVPLGHVDPSAARLFCEVVDLKQRFAVVFFVGGQVDPFLIARRRPADSRSFNYRAGQFISLPQNVH